MPDSPQTLSYEKPSLKKNRDNSLIPSSESVGDVTSRRVLSRRKALQEFYNLRQDKLKSTVPEDKSHIDAEEDEIELKLKDDDSLSQYLKNTLIEDILKLRNSITSKLNSHDMAKKSIIYDNYYELIKLGQVLGKLDTTNPPESDNSLKTLSLKLDESRNETKNDDYIDNVLHELATFINNKAIHFNTDFETIVNENQFFDSGKSVQDDKSASDYELPNDIDRFKLVQEINFLLERNGSILPEVSKTNIVADIQKILKRLDNHNEELLIIQLNELKKAFA
ncbi:uncharacterized protein PRCAT00003281001 [Priceomyces carsonii]|uniref:uncharacterized protein n=1 Tax=Priceomyces carsonii TaxID=28549 RepID=UPI002EDBB4D3|nr:unnamed protein product [Priceomyces carsonii]